MTARRVLNASPELAQRAGARAPPRCNTGVLTQGLTGLRALRVVACWCDACHDEVAVYTVERLFADRPVNECPTCATAGNVPRVLRPIDGLWLVDLVDYLAARPDERTYRCAAGSVSCVFDAAVGGWRARLLSPARRMHVYARESTRPAALAALRAGLVVEEGEPC